MKDMAGAEGTTGVEKEAEATENDIRNEVIEAREARRATHPGRTSEGSAG